MSSAHLRARRRVVAAALLVAGLGLAVASGARGGAAGSSLRILELELPGRVLDATTAELDGDGRRDLVVTWVPEGPVVGGAPRARRISIFHGRGGKDPWAAEADTTVAAAIPTVTLSVGDVVPPRGDDLVLLRPDGVELLPVPRKKGGGGAASRPRQLVGEGTFFTFSSDNAFDVWPLIHDLDGDGAAELLVPTTKGWAIWGRDATEPTRLVSRGIIRVEPEERFAPHFEQRFLGRLITRVARLSHAVPADLDGDGRLDLFSTDDRGLLVFKQRRDGTFPKEPDLIAKLPEPEGGGGGGGAGGAPGSGGSEKKVESTRLDLEDIDGDGYLDLLAARTGGTIGVFSSIGTRFLVFRGRPRVGFNLDRPDRIISVRGLSMNPVLADCDGDGKRDLVVSSLRTDMLSNIKKAIVSSVTITYLVYRGTGDGRSFEDAPFFERDVDLDLDSLDAGGAAPLVFFDGDFDGDGKRDLLEVTVPSGLSWTPLEVDSGWFGLGTPTLEPDADRRLEVEVTVSTDVRIEDVTGDGRDDVLLLYPRRDDPERTRVRAVFSPQGSSR